MPPAITPGMPAPTIGPGTAVPAYADSTKATAQMAVKLTIRRIPMIVAPFAASGIFDVSCRRRKVVYLNKPSVRIPMTWRFLRHHARKPPLAKSNPGKPAPAMGPGTGGIRLTSCAVITRCTVLPFWNESPTVLERDAARKSIGGADVPKKAPASA